jgi:hypothetical protein
MTIRWPPPPDAADPAAVWYACPVCTGTMPLTGICWCALVPSPRACWLPPARLNSFPGAAQGKERQTRAVPRQMPAEAP